MAEFLTWIHSSDRHFDEADGYDRLSRFGAPAAVVQKHRDQPSERGIDGAQRGPDKNGLGR